MCIRYSSSLGQWNRRLSLFYIKTQKKDNSIKDGWGSSPEPMLFCELIDPTSRMINNFLWSLKYLVYSTLLECSEGTFGGSWAGRRIFCDCLCPMAIHITGDSLLRMDRVHEASHIIAQRRCQGPGRSSLAPHSSQTPLMSAPTQSEEGGPHLLNLAFLRLMSLHDSGSLLENPTP